MARLFIDDTYNANPDSAMAALDVLAQVPGTKIFVLGDMGEIGPEGHTMHAAIGQYAKEIGVDHLFSLGELSHRRRQNSVTVRRSMSVLKTSSRIYAHC